MRFAVSMFPTAYSMRPDEIARAVEDRGFDALFFPDHSHIPLVRRNATAAGDGELATFYADGMDPFVALTAAAMATERLKVGTAVCLVMQRDAIQTAKEVASLDVLSNGRVLFGVGAGWDAEEMEHHGTPYSRRFTVLRERVEAMRVLWTQDVCEYHGEFVNFGPSHQRPKPVQQPHPPVYLGNNHHNALARVIRYADGWMPNYARVEDLPGMIAELQVLAAESGRGPIPVTVVNVPPEPGVIEELEAAGVAPEYRKLVVLALTPESIADEIKISDEELKQAYESVRDRLGKPERREVDQIVINDAEEAKKVAEQLASGTTFDEIVQQRKLDMKDVSLGLVSRTEILDSAVADAVFGLSAGEVSQAIKGRFGTVFARVNRIEPGQQPSLEEVSDNLRRELALRRARNVILDRHDKIEDERAAGSHLAEIAGKVGAKVFNIAAVDRSGRGPDGQPIQNVPGLNAILEEAFVTDPGVEADPVELGQGGGYAWFEIVEVTPSRDRTLDEVRTQVEERWREEQVARQLSERAEAIKTKLDAGESFAAAAPGLAVQTREKIKRNANVEGLGRGAIAAIFDTAQGRSGIAAKENGAARLVFRVTAVDVPAGEPNQDLVADLNLGIQDDILVQYVMNLQNRLGVQVNPEALQSVTGGSSGL